MEQYVQFVICLIFASAAALASKQYRDDYEYHSKTDAFYNLHIVDVKEQKAKEICITEGAQLMAPAAKEDISKLHVMLKRFPDIGDLVWVDNDGKEHESAEEVETSDLTVNSEEYQEPIYKKEALCDVVTRKGLIEKSPCWHTHPFICKVEAKDAMYDSKCGVYASDYQYLSSVGSCYKISPYTYTWNEAYAECRTEGAHLLVLNSEAERQAILTLLEPIHPHITSFHVGIRALRHAVGSPRVFRTVFNETLEDAGYNVFLFNHREHYIFSGDCGAVSKYTVQYEKKSCVDQLQFICEKEVHTPQ